MQSTYSPVPTCSHLVAFVTSLATLAASTLAQPGEVQSTELTEETISLFIGRSKVVTTPWAVKTLSVTDPRVANVEVLTDRQVLVQGKSAGSTDIVMLNEGGTAVWQARVDVELDVRHLTRELGELFPDSALEVRQTEDLVVVTGTLARAEQVGRLHALLDTYEIKYVDLTKLAGVQQVQIQVRVAEASRTAIRALGVDTTFRITTEHGLDARGITGAPAGLELWPQVGNDFGTGTVGPTTGLATLLAGFPHVDLEFFLDALAENQYLRVLAEPNLVALSGEEASFLAGGEFPIPVVQGGLQGSTSISIEYKEFGVRLSFRPTVLGDNAIRLHVAPEVSELSDIGAVQIEGFNIPAIVTRRAATTVELKSGQTFAMAGLLQQTNRGRTTRLPGLGDLPVLGPLFRSVRYERGETELLVLVTASLVEPLSVDAVPPLPGTLHIPPNDWELYAEGRIEGAQPAAAISAADAEWLKDAGLHRLRGPGAWATYESPCAESRATLRPSPAAKPPAAGEAKGPAGPARGARTPK